MNTSLQHHKPLWQVLSALLLILLTACSAKSYRQDGKVIETLMGSYTRDKQALAGIQRVALVGFTGESVTTATGAQIAPLIDLAYQQALTTIAEQDVLTFIPVEQVIASPEYLRLQATLNDQFYSPVPGLTDLAGDGQGADIAALCADLQVDALVIYRLQIDYDFPTWNAVNFKTRRHVMLLLPPDARIAWENKASAWTETLVPTGTNFKLLALGQPNAEEWAGIITATTELPQVRAAGGAPFHFLSLDAAEARPSP